MLELVKIAEHDDGVIAEIILNRPEQRNALNQEILDQLREAVSEVTKREAVRTVILSGEGRSFCAGMDLKAVQSQPEKMGNLLMTVSKLMREIRRARQPFVARVHGAAIGGGCGIMTVCDFSFTHPDSKLGYPEVDLGICPAVVAPWLIMKIGAGKARQVLLAGGTMTGAAAHELGMVNFMVDLDDLQTTTLNYARELATGGPNAIATTKSWLNKLDGSLNDEILDAAAELSAKLVQADEAQGRLAKLFSKGK